MPILAREIDIYPEGLLDRCELGYAAGAKWWALYSLPRREKELMRRLRRLEISFYTPIVTRPTRSPTGRTRVAHVPLFSNYVFLHGDESDRYRATTTNCIS